MTDLFKSTIERMQTTAAVKFVFGDAVSAQGKTIIPVARIAYGFGSGSGRSKRESEPGEGEGGGGGVVATPLGVFEVTETETRFIPLNEHRKVVAAAVLGLCLGLVWSRRSR